MDYNQPKGCSKPNTIMERKKNYKWQWETMKKDKSLIIKV